MRVSLSEIISEALLPVESNASIEWLRCGSESVLARKIAKCIGELVVDRDELDSKTTLRRRRQDFLTSSLRLSQTVAPTLHRMMNEVMAQLGPQYQYELYQVDGRNNAVSCFAEGMALVQLQGQMLTLLDEATTKALLGHEYGHVLYHVHPKGLRLRIVISTLLDNLRARDCRLGSADWLPYVVAYEQAQEITADRCELLACGDVRECIKLSMIVTTGLPANKLSWDVDAYLVQCQEYIESIESGDSTGLQTHPPAVVRAYLLNLFWESDLFRERTGLGPGTRKIADVERETQRLLESGLDDGEQDGDSPEVLLCALAVTVILAYADGAICEAEQDAIEEIFASRVPEYREYFELAKAQSIFTDMAGAVRALGAGAFLQVFAMAFHIIAADGDIKRSEVDQMMELAEVLGCGELWARWLDQICETVFQGKLAAESQRTGTTVDESSSVRTNGQAADSRSLPKPSSSCDNCDRDVSQSSRPASWARPVSEPALGARAEAKPKPREVAQAIDAFLGPVAKLGGTRTTLRRLLKLMGARANDWRKHIPALCLALDKYGLESTPPISPSSEELKYTSPLVLIGNKKPDSVSGASGESALSGAARDGVLQTVIGGLKKLQGSLISGDGRSPSIRLRGERSGRVFDLLRLDTLSPGRAERVVTLAAGNGDTPLLSPREAASIEGGARISSDLELLARDSRLRTEERGTSDLFLGTSFVLGKAGSYAVCAPLVLRPVELVRVDGSRPGWTLRMLGASCQPNLAVLRLISSRQGGSLTDEMMDTLQQACEGGPEGLVQAVAELGFIVGNVVDDGTVSKKYIPDQVSPCIEIDCTDSGLLSGVIEDVGLDQERAVEEQVNSTEVDKAISVMEAQAQASGEVCVIQDELASLDYCGKKFESIDGLRLQSAAALGFFPQSSSDLLRDYEELITALSSSEAVPNQVLGAAGYLLPGGIREHLHIDNFTIQDNDGRLKKLRMPSVALDPSQQEAVNASVAVDALVVDGPPGTGKSQVIVGLIIDALARGERVAVVSDKRAALDVIAQRMTANGFAECYGLVHDVDKDRNDLFARIAGRLAAKRPPLEADPQLQALSQEWQQIYDELLRRKGMLFGCASGEQVSLAQLMRYACATGERLRAYGLEVDVSQLHTSGAEVLRQVPVGKLASGAEAVTGFYPFRQIIGEDSFWSGLDVGENDLEMVLAEFAKFIESIPKDKQAGSAGSDRLGDERGMGTRWIACFRNAQELMGELHSDKPAKLLFAPWSEVKPTIAGLVGYQGNIFRWLIPEWYKLQRQLAQWLSNYYPEQALGRPTAEQLREYLLLARKIEEFCDGYDDLTGGISDMPSLKARLAEDRELLLALGKAQAKAENVFPNCVPYASGLANEAKLGSPELWRVATLYQWGQEKITQSLAEKSQREEVFRPFSVGSLADVAEHLRHLEQGLAQLELNRISALTERRGLLSVPLPQARARRTPEQKIIEEILHEAGKKTRRMLLRTLVRKYANEGLLDVIPVWLLSPETITVLFPRQPVFDLVVFDEASQSTLGGSLPVLLRTKRWVIAGDDKQMPPTSFFKSTQKDEDVLESEQAQASRELFDAESLLSLAGERAPHIRLTWHYRCQDERLIAFSNHAFYEGALATVPVPESCNAQQVDADGELSLSWVECPGGELVSGRNTREAEKVVEVLAEHLSNHPNDSLGVITFNIQQRYEILDAIDRRCLDDETFRLLYSQAMDKPIDRRPFVKNLENVQGDERDHIVFSLGYSPAKRKTSGGFEWKVPARFGPLALKGGERRLNVAISRARLSCTVVASFEPAQLSVGNSKNVGPRLFKLFLEYVWNVSHGEPTLANQYLNEATRMNLASILRKSIPEQDAEALDLPEAVPLAVQVTLAAEQLGYRVEQSVGSGSFKIPLALFRENCQPVAILTDEGAGSYTPYDVYVHRPELLRKKGWRVVQITSPEWFKNRQKILAELA